MLKLKIFTVIVFAGRCWNITGVDVISWLTCIDWGRTEYFPGNFRGRRICGSARLIVSSAIFIVIAILTTTSFMAGNSRFSTRTFVTCTGRSTAFHYAVAFWFLLKSMKFYIFVLSLVNEKNGRKIFLSLTHHFSFKTQYFFAIFVIFINDRASSLIWA